ncbi:helix-turn-helix domain-containing protein [Anaerobacillus sp. CMMVII]|uniref:helix-turn-helix domain-containing protein n=1 Tax=Anaerobacillus sp. CMMVII TaxID=2755588 RepID=UPI0021B81D0A|nr:helix-turn-helix domain-containing protein [Anaerobacillus sp. CMMVII]MCT8136471.1 helix-turn-helix domain-containing protein [Anaerobacillus sp. CMMVII]
MNFSFELPKDTIVTNRTELKETIKELVMEMQGEISQEEIMTVREVAGYLKVSVPTIRSMVAKKEIPFYQRGQVIRFNKSDIREWLRRNSELESRG